LVPAVAAHETADAHKPSRWATQGRSRRYGCHQRRRKSNRCDVADRRTRAHESRTEDRATTDPPGVWLVAWRRSAHVRGLSR
jgi:hypothetical protein